ncbi:hypothetical protein K9N08_00905 [Candidatus Gracilibacteria bacterium]|nr:hypothetical protein [Candidatus Gracilibacteria bacterium]MCF7856102.1 hypothetical protein [Candidatus Gracilibacteria bacterium]MCF7896521.1 hypothetical protein [Candidatus Gracilibacteria bacterium]
MNLILSNSREAKPGIRRRTLSAKIEIGTFALMVVMIFLALSVSLLYLAHANRTATRGYALKKLEIEKNQIQTQMEIWNQQISEAESLDAIKNSGVLEDMEQIKKPIYLQAGVLDADGFDFFNKKCYNNKI